MCYTGRVIGRREMECVGNVLLAAGLSWLLMCAVLEVQEYVEWRAFNKHWPIGYFRYRTEMK